MNEDSTYFQPDKCLTNKISVSGIDGLKIFNENQSHEVPDSNAVLIPSRHSRKGRRTRGRTLSTYLIGGSQLVQPYQHSHFVFRVVLTNSPNSCPPESLFSIFNTTYNDDGEGVWRSLLP